MLVPNLSFFVQRAEWTEGAGQRGPEGPGGDCGECLWLKLSFIPEEAENVWLLILRENGQILDFRQSLEKCCSRIQLTPLCTIWVPLSMNQIEVSHFLFDGRPFCLEVTLDHMLQTFIHLNVMRHNCFVYKNLYTFHLFSRHTVANSMKIRLPSSHPPSTTSSKAFLNGFIQKKHIVDEITHTHLQPITLSITQRVVGTKTNNRKSE